MKQATMTLKIYRNGKQVDEIETTNKAEIYKHIAIALLRKIEKTECVTIGYGFGDIHGIIRNFDNADCDSHWKYVYHFDGVRL